MLGPWNILAGKINFTHEGLGTTVSTQAQLYLLDQLDSVGSEIWSGVPTTKPELQE